MNLTILLPVAVTAVGLYLLIRFRFFFILHPVRTASELMSGLRDREARRSLFLALAGTLGVGNIFGVAAGIMIGGAGSLFWLGVSSIFAMIIKYAETLLVFDSEINRGGTSALIRSTFSRFGGVLSVLYAAFTLGLAFFMGGAMQSAALIDTARQGLSLSPFITSVILLFLLIPCLVGGVRKIEKITEILIPLTTIIYIIMCLSVIILKISNLWEVIKLIFSSAFTPSAAIGGGVSLLALREGFCRGILSNEAGVGTSALAHSRSMGRSAHSAGLFAMCEVVFDSLLLCMLTGVAILVSVPDISSFEAPMSLVIACFSSAFGGVCSYILPFVILAFAYSTIICWYFYGAECTSLYFPLLKGIYPIIFLTFVIFAPFLRSFFMLSVIDLLILFMSVMTLSVILKRGERIVEIKRRR